VRDIDNAPATVVITGLLEAGVFLGIGLIEGGAPIVGEEMFGADAAS
jgi:hypothetical protein